MGGVDAYIPILLTSALAEREWSASLPDRFTHEERAPGTHCIGDWVDPTAGLDDVEKRNSWSYRDSNSDSSVVQLVASRYTDYSISAHYDPLIFVKNISVLLEISVQSQSPLNG
jgi:hypothetical protein